MKKEAGRQGNMFHYKTRGTCSTQIDLEIENGVITACAFHNGCLGNTPGSMMGYWSNERAVSGISASDRRVYSS